MSSVLKALKKLENERRGADAAAPGAASQRWASGGLPSRRSRPWLLVFAGLALGLLIALILLWPGRNAPPVASAPPVTAPTAVAPGQAPPPAAVPVAATTVEPARSEAAAPVAPPVIIAPVRKEAARPVAVSPLRPVVSPPEPEVVATVPAGAPHSRGAGASSPPAPKPAPIAPPVRSLAPVVPPETSVTQVQVNRFDIPAAGQQWVAPPQLTVSEIFPPAGGERMAIVNGLPVMVGTMVDDALVEEIHDDRVVVSIGGRQVALSLQKRR